MPTLQASSRVSELCSPTWTTNFMEQEAAEYTTVDALHDDWVCEEATRIRVDEISEILTNCYKISWDSYLGIVRGQMSEQELCAAMCDLMRDYSTKVAVEDVENKFNTGYYDE